jgi:hypothetical protein
MLKRITIFTLFVGLAYFACTSTKPLAELPSKYRLVWNDDPTTSITIAWDQGQVEDPVVYYGKEDFGQEWQKYPRSQVPTRIVTGYRGMNNHFAKLSSLEPDQIYYFVIKDDAYTSDRFWFKTAPNEPKPFTFVAGGDTKSSDPALTAGRLSHQMVAKLRPLFVIFNGDFCSGNGTNDDDWQQWLNDWTFLTTTDDGRLIPIIPVHGNHEDGDYTVLNKLFNAPYQYNDEENIYYSLSFGGNFFHIIALNSQTGGLEYQTKWLEEDLKRHQNFTFKFAGYHKPMRPHTASKSENNHLVEAWAPLFYKYELDIAMEGDSHMSKITFPIRPSEEPGSYEGFIRDDENGTMYIGDGSWGATPRPNNDDKPWTLRSGSFNQFNWIHVYPEMEGKPAHAEIRTVITSERNPDNEDEIISYVDDVEALSESNVFAIPKNIHLFSTEPFGEVITYPFHEKN